MPLNSAGSGVQAFGVLDPWRAASRIGTVPDQVPELFRRVVRQVLRPYERGMSETPEAARWGGADEVDEAGVALSGSPATSAELGADPALDVAADRGAGS
jgi:hypothetical protein